MNSTPDAVRISSTPTFGAYLRFVVWAAYRQGRFLVAISIVTLAGYFLTPLLPLGQHGAADRPRASMIALILPGCVFVLMPILCYVSARRRWQTAAELRSPRTYAFTDAGVDVTSDTFNSHLAWQHVTTAHRHRDQVLLGTAQSQFFLVPLHDFASPAQLDRFLTLVKTKVTHCRV